MSDARVNIVSASELKRLARAVLRSHLAQDMSGKHFCVHCGEWNPEHTRTCAVTVAKKVLK